MSDPRMRHRWPIARLALGAVAWVAAALGCSVVAPQGRYVVEHDRSTRSNFPYIRDRVSGDWVNRRCELRVPVARRLPEPLTGAGHGDALSLQLHHPGSVQSGGLRSVDFTLRDGFRVWRIDDVLRPSDVQGRTRYGVQVKWYRTGQETLYDPLELFHMPRLQDEAPGTWSPWVVASSTREGAFGWWSEAQGASPAPPTPVAHPFEMRCLVVATDVPGTIR